MKRFRCTKEYVLLCFFLATVMKFHYTQPAFWWAILLWGLLIGIYERSVRKYVAEEEQEDEI